MKKTEPIQLLPVPHYLRELTLKADLNGVTVLREGRYRKRYTGSKTYAVDINGNLHRASELKKELAREDREGPKTKGRQAATPRKSVTKMVSKYKQSEAKTTIAKKKTYSINKPEIRARLFSMIASQPENRRELYFFTVTFPLRTDDEVIYRLFNTWLTRLRKERLLRDYLWIVERQKNGTLHFHIAVPHKMPVTRANAYMRSALTTCAKNGEIAYSVFLCRRYNGVDIAKPRKKDGSKAGPVTNFAASKRGRRALVTYLTKYLTKNETGFFRLAWHNSRGFSQLFTGVTFTLQEFCEVYNFARYVRRNSAIKNEYFQFHPWINGPPRELEGELLKLNTYIKNLN